MIRKVAFKLIMLLIILSLYGCNGNGLEEKIEGTINEEDIKLVGVGNAEMSRTYDSIQDLSSESTDIVLGKIKEISYEVHDSGFITTIEEIEILDSLKGTLHVGDNIPVRKVGGIVTFKDYIMSYSEEFQDDIRSKFNEYSDSELEKYYISQSLQGDIVSEVGNESVFFLVPNENGTKDNEYALVGDFYGKFVKMQDDRYFQLNEAMNYDEACKLVNESEIENYSDKLQTADSNDSIFKSYDEIKAKIGG